MRRADGGFLTLNLDRGDLGTRTNAQMAAIVSNAMAQWNNIGTSTVHVSRGADLPEDVTAANQAAYIGNFGDGLNPVIYDTDGTLIDALFGAGASNNTYGFWGSMGSSTPPCGFTESHMVINGKASMTDQVLTDVMGKFIGHFLGLDQTQLDDAQGLVPSSYPLMYPFAYRQAPGLYVDDIAAISALYPSANVDANYGTLNGTFVTATGAPILGANIWAENLSTGHLFSGVSDYLARRTGEFKLLLTPGLYRLHANAIRPGFHVGPWANGPSDLSFQPPLYSGSVPMTPVMSSTMFVMLAACHASFTFNIAGTITMGEECTAPSEITTPLPGTTITGPTVNFIWSQATGPITEVYLSVGTTPGGGEIFSGYQGIGQLSRRVGGIPTDGSTIYVRLMSYIKGVWQSRDYTFTAARITTPLPSELISPLPDVPLPGATVTFRWTAGDLVTSRTLMVGYTLGGSEYYGPTEQGSALSATVSNLPTDGSGVCARLSQVFNGATISQDYCYQTRYLPSPSRMLLPGDGSTLAGDTATFSWSPGYQVNERYLRVGSTVGGSDVYGAYQGNGTSRNVTGIPTDGRKIYVTLMSYVGGMWRTFDYTYTAQGTPPGVAAASNITAPGDGSTFISAIQTFQWDAGASVMERYFMVGSAVGASDIYAGYQGAALSRLVSTLPTDGRKVYVRLMSYVNGGWVSVDRIYTAAGGSGPPPPAGLPAASNFNSPPNGALLSGSSVTFQWDAGMSVAERYLMIGSAEGASDIFAGYQGAALSKTVTGIPTDGRTIYARLMSYVTGMWVSVDRTYMAAGSGGSPTEPASTITSPTPGITVGYPAATFSWTAGTGVTERYFMVGTTRGGSEIYAGYQGAALSRTVFTMPNGGITIYVRLMSYIEGSWVVKDYTYLAEP
jgi:hypothetical protein